MPNLANSGFVQVILCQKVSLSSIWIFKILTVAFHSTTLCIFVILKIISVWMPSLANSGFVQVIFYQSLSSSSIWFFKNFATYFIQNSFCWHYIFWMSTKLFSTICEDFCQLYIRKSRWKNKTIKQCLKLYFYCKLFQTYDLLP